MRESGVAVPMRDGVILRAYVLRPAGPGKFPTLVYRTPYGAKRALDSSIMAKAVARGYAVVVQDVRGRYESAGEYMAYHQEGRDGYDTIEWAARQPWSDGNVGTFGLSYPGAVQWLAAIERPPHLRAMVPAMTFSSPRNFFYSGGVFDLSWITWIWNNIAPDVRVKKNLPGPKTAQEAREEFRKLGAGFQRKLPLTALEELKAVAPWFYEWMRHEPYDPWWDWAELRGKYDRLGDVAVLNFSAWHDEAYGPEGATTNFNGLRAARRGQPDPRTQLILGPWSHGVPGPDDCKVGQRDFCPAGTIDYDAVVLNWMDRYVRNIQNGVDRLAPVRYFVMGANEWREAAEWPLPNAELASLYLAASKERMDRGVLQRDPVTMSASSTSFVSDPDDPVRDPHPFYSGANDYRSLADRSDVLVFDSAPLDRDTEITGPITAEIYLEVDAPDTDLWVRVLDVAPDGTAYNLMSPGLDVLRASYRNAALEHHRTGSVAGAGLKAGPAASGTGRPAAKDATSRRELLQPGTVYKLVLPNLMTSNVFKKFHRIRVQISATFFPGFSRNLHTGELETVSAKMRTATILIHHDKEHPSRIILPLIPPSKGQMP